MTSTNVIATLPSTVDTIERGFAFEPYEIKDLYEHGIYIWHKGSYRLVTDVEQVAFATHRIRMGRYSITTRNSVETLWSLGGRDY